MLCVAGELCVNGWQSPIQVLAPNPDPKDHFGNTAAISGDMIAIGALNESSGATEVNGDPIDNSALGSGAVYTFKIEDKLDNQPPVDELQHKVYLPMIQR